MDSQKLSQEQQARWEEERKRAKSREKIFRTLCFLAAIVPLLLLFAFFFGIVTQALSRLNWSFLMSYPSRKPILAGILPALVGSLYLVGLTAVIALPIGVGAAVYLEEYSTTDNLWRRFLEINIANLAGIPSIIYGLLGLEIFVRTLGFQRSILSGALTMSLLILPIIIITSREALRTIPEGLREACYGLGATRWQTIRQVLLPMALPGILTGAILSISRAIGETAPLIVVGALTYMAFLPSSITSPFTVLPIQIFNWTSRPEPGFIVNAAAGIFVLLVTTLLLNMTAIILRNRFQKRH